MMTDAVVWKTDEFTNLDSDRTNFLVRAKAILRSSNQFLVKNILQTFTCELNVNKVYMRDAYKRLNGADILYGFSVSFKGIFAELGYTCVIDRKIILS